MKEIINFSTKFESLEVVNPLITKYRINICVPDKPANRYIFSKEVIEGMSNTIKGSGVYAYYFEREKQIGGHSDDIVKTNYGYKRTGEPVAYGFADPYENPFWIEKDGEQWFSANVFLWTGRNPEIKEALKNPVHHSMEVAVNDKEDEYGNKIVSEAVFLGFCLLQGIDPAFENSTIEKISFSTINSDIDLLKQEYEKFINKYDDLNFKIPDGVKKNAQKGLDLRKEYNRGGTSVGLGTAKYLVKNVVATSEKIRHVANYFPRHAGDNLDEKDPPSNGYIAWLLWGGDSGRRWSEKLVAAMNKIDDDEKTEMTYFTDDLQVDREPLSEVVLDKDNLLTLNITEEFSEKNKEGENVIKEAVEKFSLNSDQIREILKNALSEYKYACGEYECNKYYVDCYDAEYVYVCDNENDKTYRINYSISELVATVNIDSKEEVIRGSFVLIGQQLSEEVQTEISCTEETSIEKTMSNEEMAKEEIVETEKEEMSSNEYVDNTAMQALNEKAAVNNQELSEELLNVKKEAEMAVSTMKEEMSLMQEKMSKMEEDMVIYMDENTKLNEFKVNIETQNKEFSVETTLKEVVGILSQEEIETCRLSSDNFSFENIDAWKNEVKAKAFNFTKGFTEKKSYIQVGFPVSDKPKNGTGLWD